MTLFILFIALFVIYLILLGYQGITTYLIALHESKLKLESTQEALKKSEANFKLLFNSTSDEIFVSGMDGRIIIVNQQACDSLGYRLEEFQKLNVKDIKSPRYRKKVDENRASLQTAREKTFESEHLTKSGEIIPVELKSRIIELNGEEVVLSISRNTIQRKELERKLLSVVIQTEEKERERFSKDMHDGLGPLLSTIKLYVNELGSHELKGEERSSFLKYINELIDEAVSSTRTISNNLMPRVIHEYGLIKAVDSFCRKVNHAGTINIQFESDELPPDLNANVQLILFRVISELINNTLKHARASHIDIRLNMSNLPLVKLSFSDNGIGFDVQAVLNSRDSGIGLKNILSRISSISGRTEMHSSPGKGFAIDIEFEI